MTNPISFYENSACCYLCRILDKCCKKKESKVQTVAEMHIAIAQAPVLIAHNRTRTWQINNGRPVYTHEQDEKKLRSYE